MPTSEPKSLQTMLSIQQEPASTNPGFYMTPNSLMRLAQVPRSQRRSAVKLCRRSACCQNAVVEQVRKLGYGSDKTIQARYTETAIEKQTRFRIGPLR